ncbi:FAD-dependent monooxygenase [Streptomyces phaeofaciens JCM 4814]|uniref:FAD-dependent oxidoreductase n=1 Tax=Streptomyces phaeofaciens TaxID=68254 RepID=A0A918HKP7_9ACTN|nr:FAD-dependent monooxygenase [Streptomyces phaeofaciens]GGT76481.1 FAD-dependent oxidoreductase [Streptomyces phaeofaciens]
MGRRGAVVVGGGIGGLAAAIGLNRIGWDVTVLERAPAFADVGAGISMHANGMRALDALGVGEAVRATVRPLYTGGTLTPEGRLLSRMDGAALERRLGTPVVGVLRADLHRVLREALPAGCVRGGEEVTDVHGVGEADLVVAADGVDSRVRAQLFPDHPGAEYSGSTVLRAITGRPLPEPPADLELTWGGGAEFGHMVFRDGRVEWHAVITAPPGVRHPDPLAAMRRRFQGWHDPIPALLDATRPDDVLHHDIHELRTPLPVFAVGRVALLGDAAHAMTPNLGQGASQALEDAAVLASCLAGESDVERALRRYDAVRRPRSQSVARAARRAGRVGHRLTRPVAVALRDTALRLAPPGAILRAALRHADWTPPRIG